MSKSDKIRSIVYNAIDEFNLSQELESRLEKKENEVLFTRAGYTEEGKLDSLTLVYFLVAVEEHLQKEFGAEYNLNTHTLIERKEKDLKNIETLIRYIETTF